MSSTNLAGAESYQFTNTHWSVVLQAQRSASAETNEALERLCRRYWYPLYAFVRRSGYSATDAEDLTQEFFSRFLGKNYLASVHRDKGKFRSFLLASLRHFLANEWDRAKSEKRGGRQTFVSLEGEAIEERYTQDAGARSTPEALFEHEWALTILDKALHSLKKQYTDRGKGEQFEALKCFLSGQANEGAYDLPAVRLNTTPGAIAVAVHRLRQQYGEAVRAEVAHTVSSPSQVEEEMHHVLLLLTT
jgi:DNA-directed RNA polymerase specialized sigma24 family protein